MMTPPPPNENPFGDCIARFDAPPASLVLKAIVASWVILRGTRAFLRPVGMVL